MTAEHHPEELIDRARQGPLAPRDQTALERHLAACAACVAHLAQLPWFEREMAPQARDDTLDRRAVQGAMRRMGRSSAVGGRRGGPRWLRLSPVGVLAVFGVTAAAALVGRTISSQAPAPRPAPRSPESAHVAWPPVAPMPDLPTPAESSRPSVEPPSPSRAASVRPAVTAAALFDRAGKLRRDRLLDDAIAVYLRLEETFPDAREAQLSFALAGQLMLERGRPSEALAQFDRHLEVGGVVGEEALVGRATALEQLRRIPDAISTWKSLLDRYPGSIYAERARTRLTRLIDRP